MAIALVQQAVANDNTAITGPMGATLVATVAGNLLVASVSWNTDSSGSATLNDSAGQTWARAATGSRTGTIGTRNEIWYCPNTVAGVTSVSVTISAAAALSLHVSEWSGVSTTAALDSGSASSVGGTASPIVTPTLTPSAAGALVIGAFNISPLGSTTLATAGYTNMTATGAAVAGAINQPAYQIGPTGAQSISWTLGAAANWGASLAIFVAAVTLPPNTAQPVTTVLLGGTDISSEVASVGPGTPSIIWDRGASFDGSSEAAGSAMVLVRNDGQKFSPANTGSPYASLLVIGSVVRISTVYNNTRYELFGGYLKRIVPLPGSRFAELHFEDALWMMARGTTTVAVSDSTVTAFRAAILNDIAPSILTALSQIGPEADSLPLWAENVNGLSLLNELNANTGSLHYIKPTAAGPTYTTIDRSTLQSAAVADSWSDTDLTSAYPSSLGGYDYTDEGVVNHVIITPHFRHLSGDAVTSAFDTTFYSVQGLTVPAGQTQDIWVPTSGPAIIRLSFVGSSPITNGVTATAFASSILVHIPSSNAVVTYTIRITGRLTLDDPSTSIGASDYSVVSVEMSQALDLNWLPGPAAATGLANWIIYRYARPRAKPSVTIVNDFPGSLQREVGDRVTVSSSLLSLTNVPYFIRHLAGSISDGGAAVTMVFDLEEAPALVDIVTIGGSAAQGVGGSSILGY